MLNSRRLAIVWAVCVLIMTVFFINKLLTVRVFESNILALLPFEQYDANRSAAIKKFTHNLSPKVIFLISSKNRLSAQAGAELFFSKLKSNMLFSELTLKYAPEKQNLFATQHYPFRFGLLTLDQQVQFKNQDYEKLWMQLLRKLSGPATANFSNQLAQDPLLLYPDFLLQMPKMDGEIINGMYMIKKDNKYHVLITGILNFSPFSVSKQQQLKQKIKVASEALKTAFPDQTMTQSGVVFHAMSGYDRAIHDISTIGVGSILGILILILSTFRTLYPVALSLLSIATGIIAGIASCLLFFGEVHLLTLVFGSSLIGVSIDYAFHYFVDLTYSENQSPTTSINHIISGISLGMITSIIGYLTLTLTKFTGLQQIALFSATGLLASWLCVVLWFPLFPKKIQNNQSTFIYLFSQKIIQLWSLAIFQKIMTFIIVLLIPLAVIGIMDVHFNDDIRILQTPSTFQKQQDSTIQQVLSRSKQPRYILVKAKDPEQLLIKEEVLIPHLQKLVKTGELAGYQATALFFPSKKRQTESIILLQKAYQTDSPLYPYLAKVGIDKTKIEQYIIALNHQNHPYLDISNLTDFELGNKIKYLWLGEISGDYYAIIMLDNLKQKDTLLALLKPYQFATLVDQAADISSLFGQYRERAIQLMFAATVFIFIFLLFRYPFIKSLLIIFPPIFSSILTIAFLSFISATINIFHIFAIILILAIGIDYTLFFAESSSKRTITMLAISLSAITTLLSFGLLALSDTKAIHAFGITLTIGILLTFLLSPMVGLKK